MELAATALAQAVGIGGGNGESEDDEDDDTLSSRSDEKLWISLNVPGKHQQKKGQGRSTDVSGVTIDALVGVLQDPDRGVPRALETRLKDVKIRRGDIVSHHHTLYTHTHSHLQMWVLYSLVLV